MAVRVVRLGSARVPDEGLRIGTVRRSPRGVRKADYARLHYYDLWLPELAPSTKLLNRASSRTLTPARWARFVRSYRREMHQPGTERLLQLLARLSRRTDFSVGCYCEREERCHRTILRALLAEHGAKVVASARGAGVKARRGRSQ